MASIKIDVRSSDPRNLQREGRAFVQLLGRAAMVSTDQASLAAQKAIRGDMTSSRLGKLSRTVRSTSDRRKRVSPIFSADQRWRAGAVVYRNTDKSPRAAGAWEAYTKGPIIVPKRGKWLAFPTDNVPKRAGRRKMTASLYAAGRAASTGPLVFIPGPTPSVAYLIAKDVTVPGFNKPGVASRRKGGGRVSRDFVVMFILIRRTKRDIRFRPVEVVRREAARIPKQMDQIVRNGLARRGAQVVAGVQIPAGVS